MDSISEIRLSYVMPLLAEKVRQMADQLAQEGILIRVVQALRNTADQDSLYNQGRTTPGPVVTNVKGGYSYHNFGLAVDCVPSNDDQIYSPDWNNQHPSWQRMVTIAKGLGLDCGAEWRTFPDFPHFQLTGMYPENEPSDEVRELFSNGGTQAVWDSVMKAYQVSTQ